MHWNAWETFKAVLLLVAFETKMSYKKKEKRSSNKIHIYTINLRPSGKSRHVDFSLGKPIRWFLVQKADTSILVEKGHSSGSSLNYYYLSWDSLTLATHLARPVFYLYVFSNIVSSIIRLTNWSFLIEKKIQARRMHFYNEKSTCPLFEAKIDVSAFPTKNRCVSFPNEKSTCRLFQRKIDVSAFFTRLTKYTLFLIIWPKT